jgi:group I intron endonuclease
MDNQISGIYRVINKINGKSYIGQSVDIYARWIVHKTGFKRDRGCRRLNSAIKAHGINNFEFEILEITPNDKNILNTLEKKFIKEYHTFIDDPNCWGYNLTDGGDSFKPSKESIARNAETRRNKYKSGELSAWNKGLKLTNDQKKKYIATMMAKWEDLLKHDWNLIKNYDKTTLGWIGKAAQETGLHPNRIRSICKIKGISWQTKSRYVNKKGVLEEDWEIIRHYDRTKDGWRAKVTHNTGMSYKHIKSVCKKMGVEISTRKVQPTSNGKKLPNSILDERYNIIKGYDFTEYGQLTRAVKETGLSMSQIRLIIKKIGH